MAIAISTWMSRRTTSNMSRMEVTDTATRYHDNLRRVPYSWKVDSILSVKKQIKNMRESSTVMRQIAHHKNVTTGIQLLVSKAERLNKPKACMLKGMCKLWNDTVRRPTIQYRQKMLLVLPAGFSVQNATG